uniref:Putative secreted protein n=1 Tax=Ixodes ricinus TaxID=34613 RepID=A0A6B0UP78_IXORI
MSSSSSSVFRFTCSPLCLFLLFMQFSSFHKSDSRTVAITVPFNVPLNVFGYRPTISFAMSRKTLRPGFALKVRILALRALTISSKSRFIGRLPISQSFMSRGRNPSHGMTKLSRSILEETLA